jgi:cyclic pyranopterin monophosphate synthase
MVDVSAKALTKREAQASAFVRLKPKVLQALPRNSKGDPLQVARLAGIMAAKRTAELIPMCHSLELTHVDVTVRFRGNGVAIRSSVTSMGQTGVEMEAMVAACVAALTIYDMAKAVDKAMTIESVRLCEKSGGKSGRWLREV